MKHHILSIISPEPPGGGGRRTCDNLPNGGFPLIGLDADYKGVDGGAGDRRAGRAGQRAGCLAHTEQRANLGPLSGLGAATADALYGAIAGFSITLVIGFLLREEFWIRVIGGILLVCIGCVYFRKPPQSLARMGSDGGRALGLSSRRCC